MEWWDAVRLALEGFLEQHGVLAGFTLVLIEEAGVPVPVPGDFLMLLLGVRASEGRVPLWLVLLVLETATVLGASVLYELSRRAGHGLVYRYGRYVHLPPERLDRAERWILQHGARAIVAGRLIPGLRIATVVCCGIFKVPFRRFLPALAVGGFLYILGYVLLGFFLGPPVLAVVSRVHLPISLLGSLVPLALLLVWVIQARRGLHLRAANDASQVDHVHRLRDGAVAGALATVISTLTMNVLLHVAGDAAILAPGELIEAAQIRLAAVTFGRSHALALLAIAPAFLLVGMLWGAAYGTWIEPRLAHLPDALSGVLFALLPLALALLVVPPVMNVALLGPGRAGMLLTGSEAIRHLVYGLALGLTYPLRLAAAPLPRWPPTDGGEASARGAGLDASTAS